MAIVAYLAPEIPALSATFVYEELQALDRHGIAVVPFSVHRPRVPAVGQETLADRVGYLYAESKTKGVLQGLSALLRARNRSRAVRWLLADMRACGPLRTQSLKLVYQFLTAAKLAEMLRRQGCDHLHVHFAHVPAQIAMYASALSGVPFTVMAHANDIFERGLLLPQKAERALKFLTISEYNRSYLARIGVPVEKLAVMRCGVSFETAGIERTFEQRQSFRLGTLGRLVEKKGVDVLIRALARLRSSCPVELSIAGDGPLRTELEELARTEGVADRVHFEGGMAHGDVAPWMRGLDLFVLACRQDGNGDMDGIPVVLMEAMSQWLPVVSTRLSGIPELVRHEETGLLAEPNDAEDLARQIERLIESPDLQKTLAQRAERHVQSEFGREINIQRLIGHLGLKVESFG